MALSLSRLPSIPPPPPPPTKSRNLPPLKLSTLNFSRHKTHRFSSVTVKATEEQQQQPTTTESESQPTTTPSDEELSDVGREIKKAMMEREKKDVDESLWGGVADEIGKIEWPAFNKVIGTTGVVLGVIAGSSVVLLTVNAVLAELSDRVFAGRGVQGFFG